MAETVEQLRLHMEQAAADEDYELAARLRDRLSILRSLDTGAESADDTSGLTRQQPGSMGIGTSRQRVTPPPGWKPPPKPDLMAKRRSKK
ncbi:UvrB/UvrC motif-containing protein [Sphingomonas sp.]|uniref:UvrB/UvrC motif-containing protein n=1 Tax=Sphingomonas sp. TaxID=28214 RepID=UPI0025DE10D8|nr:UvrB/UvrC motif-containing protein [Sphingomonas sp.]